jgi:hypothetical protein
MDATYYSHDADANKSATDSRTILPNASFPNLCFLLGVPQRPRCFTSGSGPRFLFTTVSTVSLRSANGFESTATCVRSAFEVREGVKVEEMD